MIQTALKKIFGTKHDREMKRLRPLVDQINAFESKLQGLSHAELTAQTQKFKEALKNGSTLDDLLPEAFATCREASKRVLGMRHYDVQLIGGIILHRGKIAEMRTGEGKTLVATLAVYLNALAGKGVHVVTVNDYLASRDAEWMGQLYQFLGLTTKTIVHGLNDRERKEAYAADITYATNNELGFDYLRDNMKFALEDYVQRDLNFAIIDECDSILIDEARTPLIISGPAEDNTESYLRVNSIIPQLKRDRDFVMEEKSRTASLTEEGSAFVEKLMGVENLYDPVNLSILHHINQGIKAYHLFKRDVDYMVRNGEIVIVDEFTGRLMAGRRWSDGLHQAIEAKEGVRVRSENQTLASITFQNYFRMYSKLAGMTGTADTEAVEFKKIYNLEVSVIPTNRPIARKDLDDEVYKNQSAKFKAIIKDLKEKAPTGQPILVGTVSIEKSEQISRALSEADIPHKVLNAKHHEKEAEIIAQAGRKGAITIATNMAGRGTDIVLGGNPEYLAKAEHEEGTPEYEEALDRYRKQCSAEKEEVLKAGGLYIVGTERHDSRRIDNQLRGRAGRQGDPGASKFYLALDDNLMRIFNGERIQKIMDRLNVPDDEPITAPMVSRAIENSQKKVEGHNFDIRKNILEYDDVMNQQRRLIYGMRRRVLQGVGNEELIRDQMSDITSYFVDQFINPDQKPETWNPEGLTQAVFKQFLVQLDLPDKQELTFEKTVTQLKERIAARFESQKQSLGEHWAEIQRVMLLQAIDHHWKEHLLRVDQLKEGISLRSYAQKDPLIEYKKEAFLLFEHLNSLIASEALEKLFKVQIMTPEAEAQLLAMQQRALDESAFEFKTPEPEMQPQTAAGSVPSGFDGQSQRSEPSPRRGVTLQGSDLMSASEPQKLNRAQRRNLKKKRP